MPIKQLNYDVLLNKIGVSRGTCDLLCVYYDMLKFWNKKINLVSRKSIETSWERHFQIVLNFGCIYLVKQEHG